MFDTSTYQGKSEAILETNLLVRIREARLCVLGGCIFCSKR